jgi:hypothetical protein
MYDAENGLEEMRWDPRPDMKISAMVLYTSTTMVMGGDRYFLVYTYLRIPST